MPDHSSVQPHDQKRVVFGKLVVARLKVCLAFGETNNDRQITRSVICSNMREHSLSTAVRDHCRALEQIFDKVVSQAPWRLT